MMIENPFRPGAGHMPPYLAGRQHEQTEFKRLLSQTTILENLILTGLRGVGKTVLLQTYKPLAVAEGWLWVGTDMSEQSTVSEESIALRLITDLSVVTSRYELTVPDSKKLGFVPPKDQQKLPVGFEMLTKVYSDAPGLVSDKLKHVLKWVASVTKAKIIFAYDEAQVLSDHATKEQYPMSMLLDVYQSIQKQDVPFMLALTGLPTLFPKLVEARTYAERMFRVIQLEKLNDQESKDAIVKPINDAGCPMMFSEDSLDVVVHHSAGYPYFLQFICREVFDVWIQQSDKGEVPSVPIKEIVRKLDSDFFAGRWARVTDRQRELMTVIAKLESSEEFSVQDVVQKSKDMESKSFGASQVNQMLNALINAGLVYKNRHGRYSFAVPLLSGFINRQLD